MYGISLLLSLFVVLLRESVYGYGTSLLLSLFVVLLRGICLRVWHISPSQSICCLVEGNLFTGMAPLSFSVYLLSC